jgi:MoaA/NifB/PqqE/SkfB family radical SAM enzyme
MPWQTFVKAADIFRGNRLILHFAPFMNGDPMLEDRLPEFVAYAKRTVGCRSSVVTNGTFTPNRRLLVHPDLDVCFTISAATPETYAKVHGRPLFDAAISNFQWLAHNKRPSQSLRLHFITTANNAHELPAWTDMFKGYQRTVFPVHRSALQKDSELVKGQSFEPYTLDAEGRSIGSSVWSSKHPCPVWNIMAIGPNGEFMHCCDHPPEYSYGNVFTTPWREAWARRNATRGEHELCQSCSLRRPDYKEIFKKHLGAP